MFNDICPIVTQILSFQHVYSISWICIGFNIMLAIFNGCMIRNSNKLQIYMNNFIKEHRTEYVDLLVKYNDLLNEKVEERIGL